MQEGEADDEAEMEAEVEAKVEAEVGTHTNGLSKASLACLVGVPLWTGAVALLPPPPLMTEGTEAMPSSRYDNSAASFSNSELAM